MQSGMLALLKASRHCAHVFGDLWIRKLSSSKLEVGT